MPKRERQEHSLASPVRSLITIADVYLNGRNRETDPEKLRLIEKLNADLQSFLEDMDKLYQPVPEPEQETVWQEGR